MKKSGVQNWHFDVLLDMSMALRRDGLTKTAELLDDAMQVLAEESANRAGSGDQGTVSPWSNSFPVRTTSRH